MTTRYKRVFYILMLSSGVLSLGIQTGYSQNSSRPEQEVVPPSPTAGELAKYISYPVDLSNGLIKISIPLFEITDGDITIPITLNYHASGLKPNIRSSDWLGDGWSLGAGPSLSRTIDGGPDEIFYYYDMLQNPEPTYQQLNLVVQQEKDIALDEFRYSLLNNSGRLYFKRIANNQIRPVTIPVDPIKVSLPTANNYTEFINISDTRGLQYYFGGSDRSYRDFTMNHYGASSQEVVTSWKINRIYSPLTNREVTFEYTNNVTETPYYREIDEVIMLDAISCQCASTIPAIKVSKSGGDSYYRYNATEAQLELTDPFNLNLPSGYTFPMRSIQTVTQYNSYLETIRFGAGYITFSKNEDGRAGLTSIRIYDKTDALIKHIELDQYASGNPAVLKLEAVRIVAAGSSEVEKYSFVYNGSMINRNTRSVDKWGYYNAANNTTLVPAINVQATYNNYPSGGFIVPINIPGGNRESNELAMQQGMLTGIVYPTGGRTNFIYEAHRYADNGVTKLAGGLRIKQVQEINESDEVVYKNYRYSTTSGLINDIGVLNVVETGNTSPPIEHFYNYSETECYQFYGAPPMLGSSFNERHWVENSMVNLFSEKGSSVSYPFVTEIISADLSGNEIIGKTEYRFDVSSSYPLKYQNTNIVLDSKDDWSKGSFLAEVVFKGGDNSLDTVSNKTFSYDLDFGYGSADTKITQYYVYKKNRIYGASEDVVDGYYKNIVFIGKELSTGHNYLIEETEDSHATTGAGSVTTTTNYFYDNPAHQQVTRRAVTHSDGKKEITLTTYPPDYSNTGGFTGEMKAGHLIAYPIEQVTYLESGSSRQLISGRITTYKAGGRGEKNQELVLQTLEPVEGSAFKFSSRASAGVFPPAGSAAAFAPDWRYAVRLTYNSYDNRGNVRQYTLTDGPATSYLWDYQGMYPVAEVQNAAQTQLAYTSFEAEGKGNWSYAGAAVADGTAPTGHRVYALSGGSISKSGLAASRSYLLTYWAKSGSAGSISGGAAEVVRSYNGWTQYRRKVSGVSAVTLSGTVRVDELRLHPMDASMRSFTYDPLVGVTSETDASGKLRYYQYDDFQRLETIRDLNGNLLEHYRYHYRTP